MPEFVSGYEQAAKERGISYPMRQMNKPLSFDFLQKSPPPGAVGLELEIEGTSLPSEGSLSDIVGPETGVFWKAAKDGSLRGENLEYVFSTAANISEVPYLVNSLYSAFTRKKTILNLSNRCSTHIHINASKYKLNDLIAVVVLWSSFEQALVNWCGPSRKRNHFCMTVEETPINVEALEEFLSQDVSMGLTRSIFSLPEGAKYTSLNLLPLTSFGSIEFRIFDAFESPDEVINCVNFVYTLCEYARTNYRDPSSLASDISERGGKNILRDICSKANLSVDLASQIIYHPENSNFQHMVIRGFREVQGLALGFPWAIWLKEIEKDFVPNPFSNPKNRRKAELYDNPVPNSSVSEGLSLLHTTAPEPPPMPNVTSATAIWFDEF